jgi:hypothetical protein
MQLVVSSTKTEQHKKKQAFVAAGLAVQALHAAARA